MVYLPWTVGHPIGYGAAAVQFIGDGPDIPAEIIAAQRDGTLLLFCGAGVSVPAGLPDFRTLVERVAAHLGESLVGPPQADEFRAGQFDRILERFERLYPRFLRSRVRQELTTLPDAELGTHKALRSLASHHLHGLRLVTTNFDDLFQRVAKPTDLPLAAAPALPVPKPGRWRGVVHLHGRIQSSDPECRHLVLTSSDFGVAYLTEGWASRFVTEAFNHFVVLFIGYAVSDPVMRYLIDALAAERAYDNRVRQAFALAPAPPHAFDQAQKEWSDKNITPILYPEDPTHSKLHETLVAWAQMWELGDQSRRTIVRTHAELDPNTLGTEALSQVLWAVGDNAGIGAEAFASLGTAAHLGWRDFFDKQGLLAAAAKEPPPPTPLVDAGSSTHLVAAPLAPSTLNLGRWLACHVASPDLLRWAVEKGSALHPYFRYIIDSRLSDEEVQPLLRRAWRILLDAPISHRQGHDPRTSPLPSLLGRISSEPWGVGPRTAFLQLLTPRLTVDQPFTGQAWNREQPQVVSDFLSGDCKLSGGQSLSMYLQRARSREDWAAISADLAFDLVRKLRDALDLLASVDRASEDYDTSYIDRRTLGSGGNAYEADDWAVLIDLLIESFTASVAANSRHASVVAEMCCVEPYPIFRRLTLHFAARSPWPAVAAIADRLTTDPDRWLWSFYVQSELFALLPILWAKLDSGVREALASKIQAGPSREFFRSDLSAEQVSTAIDRMMWERLSLLGPLEPGLDTAANARLAALRSAHPDWDEAELIQPAPGSQMILGSGTSGEDALLTLPIEDVVALLSGDRAAPFDLTQQWYGAAGREPQWALWVLAMLHNRGQSSSVAWSSGLHGIARAADMSLVTEIALAVPFLLPHSQLQSMTRQLSYLLDSVSKDLMRGRRAAFLEAWDRVREVAREDPAEEQDDIFSGAINHSLSILAESLLNLVRSAHEPRGGGISADVRERLTVLASESLPSGRMARVAIAARIQWLHDLDATWTRGTLVPYLDWSHSAEARALWCGVTHAGPIQPSLFSALKTSFILAFHKFMEFDRRTQSLLANLLVVYALESADALATADVREALTLLDDTHRAAIAWTLGRKLKDAGDQAADLWVSRLGPWITQTWPKAGSALGPNAADRLAELALLTGSAFPQAVEDVRPFLVPLNNMLDVGGLVHDLCEDHFVSRFPEAALVLIEAVTPVDMTGVEDLARALDIILQTEPLLAEDPMVRRLRDNASIR